MFTIPLVNPLLRMALRIISIVVFILTLISAYGGKCNPEYLTIPAVLCLVFLSAWSAHSSGMCRPDVGSRALQILQDGISR